GAQLANGPEIYLFTSLASEQAVLTKLITIGVASAGLALFAAIIVAFLATRNVLVPIRRLGLAARRLGEGDLDVRLEVEGADEIADVSRTFNETAAALARSMDELRAMDAASRRFVADVSHELRTPLTAMTAVTEVLEDVDGADQTTVSAAHLIANETKRLARLVEDLMEISRFDAGTAAMRLEDINLPELVSATLDARGWSAKATVTAPVRLGVVVDARRLDVVIANLVGNALKHGGEPVAVDVWEDNGWATVQVTDSGPGVPPEALPHIFDRFYKADRARGRSEGSGLGLSIAFENARMHGGELSVRNRAERGAVFTFRFPVRAGAAEPELPTGLAGLPESRPGGLGSGSWRRPPSGSGQAQEVKA
ncbi:MAG TPA: HAMP domain-containing sensor histidine kinase, partial [Actinocrinis sp.]